MKNSSANRLVTIFILAHLLLWTLLPTLVRANLPLDAIEGTAWGHQLMWGYDKNPFMNAWLTRLATTIGGEWTIYLFSQLSVAACFFAVYQIGKKVLVPTYAVLAVMLLEGIQYYHFHAIDFNDNTLELGFWALTIYFFYQSLRMRSLSAWILTGLFAGLGVMTKYYTLALLASLAIFLFMNKENRQQCKTISPYLGLLSFLIIITPHTLWLFSHDFITVTYVFARASSIPRWTNHFFYPAQFAWQQLEVFLPAVFLFSLLFIGKKPRVLTPALPISSFDKQFLFFASVGPLLLTMLLSLLLGTKLRAGWGMPLLSFWTISLFAIIQPVTSKQKCYAFITGIFILMFALAGAYTFSIIRSNDTSTANFPGKNIAMIITQLWRDQYHTPLAYVAGSRWLGGNIEFYSNDHPAVFMEWNQKHSPWINMADFKQKGGVFVWSLDEHEILPDDIKKQFPSLKPANVISFSWQRNNTLPPTKIGVAILPPASR